MKRFDSEVDWWVPVLIFGSLGGALVPVLSHPAPALAEFWLTLTMMTCALGFCLWLVLATYYTVDGNTLLIHSGPFSWQIRISEISSVTDTHNPLSSPALSLDRLKICYGDKQIMISPKDKAGFRRAIGFA